VNVCEIFKCHGINPEEIVAEITERETVRDINAVHTFARELTDLGVRLAVDDFGSGFSTAQVYVMGRATIWECRQDALVIAINIKICLNL